jgi:aminoglycoside phosphotransferase (APT) family kinase protein
MAERANAPRFDLARLEAYLKGAIPGFGGPAQIKRFSGGQSNPTFLLSTADRSYVLRKKPDGPLLPSAHAVDREYRVMRTVRAAGVPAPVMLCLTLK